MRACAWFFRDVERIHTQHGLNVTRSVNRLRPVERSQCESSATVQCSNVQTNIRFCYKLGKTATEACGMLVQVYGREAVSRKCVYEWFKRFREEKETTEDEPSSDRPSTSRTPEMIEKVRQMLEQDRRLELRLIGEEFGISDKVHTIVSDDLSKRKICSRFVPHKLTDERKAKGMETSGDFISMYARIHCSWKTPSWEMRMILPVRSGIKTAIDGVVFTYFPATKKSRLQKSKVKTLLIAFFDNKGITH